MEQGGFLISIQQSLSQYDRFVMLSSPLLLGKDNMKQLSVVCCGSGQSDHWLGPNGHSYQEKDRARHAHAFTWRNFGGI